MEGSFADFIVPKYSLCPLMIDHKMPRIREIISGYSLI